MAKLRLIRIVSAVVLGVGLLAGLQIPAFSADGTVLKGYTTGSGLPNNWIKGLFHDGANLLVTTTTGTAVLAPGEERFAPFAPGPGFKGQNVTGVADFGGKTYIATEAALNVRDGKKWSSLDRYLQVQHGEEALHTDGKVLYTVARVMYGGVLKFDGSTWAIIDRGPGTGIMNNATCVLARGSELYIGTTTNGLYYFNGKDWKVLAAAEGLPGVWVTSLAANDEGVWVGCYNGLALFDGDKFKVFTVKDGLPGNKISSLKVVKGKLVAGTFDSGLVIRQGRIFVPVTMEKGLSDNRIEALEPDDAGVWVGTINGLNLVEVR